MTIDDQYNRRRDHQQTMFTEAQQYHLRNSGDSRIQKSTSSLARLFGFLSRGLVRIKSKRLISIKQHTHHHQQGSEGITYTTLQSSYEEQGL